MNAKFAKYVKCLAQAKVSPTELAAIKEELHKTFAALSQEDQKYAEMLLDDIAHGNITLESGMTLQDYITQYKTKALSRDIDLAVNAFGLDKTLLVDILGHGKLTGKNLDEYGRFGKLVKSVDDDKAKKYLEQAQGVSLSMIGYRTHLSTVLKEFLISGGKGEKIPKIKEPTVIKVDWPDADVSYAPKAAEGESSDAN
jgi:type I restriction enzyme R subunit